MFFRFGGTYLDLDVISLRPIQSIEAESFFCTEVSDYLVANGLLRFEGDIGHTFVDLLLKYLNQNVPIELSFNCFILENSQLNSTKKFGVQTGQLC